MSDYAVIRVYTRERAVYEGANLAHSIVAYIKSLKVGARCLVLRGVEGCFEDGSLASSRIVDLSHDMPLVVEIALPPTEATAILAKLETMVTDGIVSIVQAEAASIRSPEGILPAQLLVRDIMTPKPMAAHTYFSVHVLVELLLDAGLKALPVVDERGAPVGIVTQQDLVGRADMPARLGILRSLPSSRLESWLQSMEGWTAERIMTSSPRCIRDDQRAAEAVRIMVREGLKRLPVLDPKGALAGMVSRIDVLRALSRKAAARASSQAGDLPDEVAPRLVRDIHRRDRLALAPGASLGDAIAALASEESQRAVVVDDEGRLLGLVSDEMLIRALNKKRCFLSFRSAATRSGSKVEAIMRRDLVSVREDSTVGEVLDLMTGRGLKRVPVVDEGGRFRGTLRRDSLLAALSTPDDASTTGR